MKKIYFQDFCFGINYVIFKKVVYLQRISIQIHFGIFVRSKLLPFKVLSIKKILSLLWIYGTSLCPLLQFFRGHLIERKGICCQITGLDLFYSNMNFQSNITKKKSH